MATELKHTVAPSGGNFTSLDAALDHIDGLNLVTLDQYASIEIFGDWSGGPDTAACIIGYDIGMTTDATRYVHVYTTGLAARTAASPLGVDTTKYVLSVSNYNVLYIRLTNYVKLTGLQMVSASQNANSQQVIVIVISGAGHLDISSCIFKGSNNGTYYQQGLEHSSGSMVTNIWNSLYYNFHSVDSNSRIIDARADTNIYSSTLIGGYWALMRGGGTMVVKNTYAGGAGNADYYSTMTCTTCASSDGVARDGIAAAVRSIAVSTTNFVNVSAGTEDYHLKVGTALIGAGTDTSGDAAPMNFTTDIDGDIRSGTWDVGADEYAAGGATYNESVTFSSTPSISRAVAADLLGSVGLASTPALSLAGAADLLGGVTMLSNPAFSALGGKDVLGEISLSSSPAVSMACVLDIFPSLMLLSNPALAASAVADFYNSLTLASTSAAVMAAVADLFASLALASDPAFAAVGGSDFYEALGFSSNPALSNAVFKEAFGELTLLSSPAFAASALADLYAAITLASACGISLTALADLFATMSLSSTPAIAAAGTIGGTVIQKMVMESISVEEKTLRSKVEKLTGDIDIINRILTNPWDDIAKKSTTWERTEKIQKDE